MVLSYTSSQVRQAQRDILGPEVLEERTAGNKGAALSPTRALFFLSGMRHITAFCKADGAFGPAHRLVSH